MARTAKIIVPGPAGEPSECVHAQPVGKGVYQIADSCFEDNPLQVGYGDHVATESFDGGLPVAVAPVEKPGLFGRLFG